MTTKIGSSSHHPALSDDEAGFTLLETIVCVAIIATIATITVLVASSTSSDLSAARRELLARIAETKALAAANADSDSPQGTGATLAIVRIGNQTRLAIEPGSSWSDAPTEPLAAHAQIALGADDGAGLHVSPNGDVGLTQGIVRDGLLIRSNGSVGNCDPTVGVALTLTTAHTSQTITSPCDGGPAVAASPTPVR